VSQFLTVSVSHRLLGCLVILVACFFQQASYTYWFCAGVFGRRVARGFMSSFCLVPHYALFGTLWLRRESGIIPDPVDLDLGFSAVIFILERSLRPPRL
jgi:hypothetical protein